MHPFLVGAHPVATIVQVATVTNAAVYMVSTTAHQRACERIVGAGSVGLRPFLFLLSTMLVRGAEYLSGPSARACRCTQMRNICACKPCFILNNPLFPGRPWVVLAGRRIYMESNIQPLQNSCILHPSPNRVRFAGAAPDFHGQTRFLVHRFPTER